MTALTASVHSRLGPAPKSATATRRTRNGIFYPTSAQSQSPSLYRYSGQQVTVRGTELASGFITESASHGQTYGYLPSQAALVFPPAEGRKLSGPERLVTRQDGIPEDGHPSQY